MSAAPITAEERCVMNASTRSPSERQNRNRLQMIWLVGHLFGAVATSCTCRHCRHCHCGGPPPSIREGGIVMVEGFMGLTHGGGGQDAGVTGGLDEGDH